MADCIFCKIANKQVKAGIVRDSDNWVAFKDSNPQSPVHVLIIPKKHIENWEGIVGEGRLIGEMGEALQLLATELGITDSGYRIVINCNKDGGQTVSHLHMHLMGGRQMQWPPG